MDGGRKRSRFVGEINETTLRNRVDSRDADEIGVTTVGTIQRGIAAAHYTYELITTVAGSCGVESRGVRNHVRGRQRLKPQVRRRDVVDTRCGRQGLDVPRRRAGAGIPCGQLHVAQGPQHLPCCNPRGSRNTERLPRQSGGRGPPAGLVPSFAPLRCPAVGLARPGPS